MLKPFKTVMAQLPLLSRKKINNPNKTPSNSQSNIERQKV